MTKKKSLVSSFVKVYNFIWGFISVVFTLAFISLMIYFIFSKYDVPKHELSEETKQIVTSLGITKEGIDILMRNKIYGCTRSIVGNISKPNLAT